MKAMNHRYNIFLIPLFAAALSAPSFAQRLETMLYMVDNEECFQSFKTNIKQIDIVGPQCYRMDQNGVMWGTVDQRILDLARIYKVKVMPLVMNPGFDQPMFHQLLHNPEAQERAVRNMLDVCKQHQFYGMQFDFENIHITDKDAFTIFYRKTAALLHENGFAISIAVVPRTSDYPGSTIAHKLSFEYWKGLYDYKALAEVSDFISYMTYEQHMHRTTPGPVAGVPWTEACLKYVLKDVPPEKISLGIPFFTNYWYPSAEGNNVHVGGRGVDYQVAMGLAERFGATPRWDEYEKVTVVVYDNDWMYEYLFVEDARSLKAKLDLAKKYKLRGMSAWRLGHEDPAVWNVIEEARR